MWAAVTLFGLCIPLPCQADPVTITGGTLVASGLFDVGPVSTLTAPGVTISARTIPGQARVDPLTFCDGTNACAPGAPLSIGFALDAVDGLVDVTFERNGVRYEDFNLGDGAGLSFEGIGSLIAPAFSDGAVVLTAPFTMTGFFVPPASAPNGHTLELAGRGTARVWLTPGPILAGSVPDGWMGQRVEYSFEGPAETPEPSTMLLMAGGIAALVRRRRR